MEIGKGLQVWKVELDVSWKRWGLGVVVGDPEGMCEDIGVLLVIGPLLLFVGRGMTWQTDRFDSNAEKAGA